jgi:hypothetical protein
MNKNVSEREDFDEVEITLDFEDAIVQPVDGVIIQGDDEEIKLLFFYVKPESNHDEDGVARCRCVAEFRVSRSRFMNISRDINIKVRDIQRGKDVMVMFG